MLVLGIILLIPALMVAWAFAYASITLTKEEKEEINKRVDKKVREYRRKHPKTKRSNSSAWPLSLWNDDNLPD
jgi:hypothetical protein